MRSYIQSYGGIHIYHQVIFDFFVAWVISLYTQKSDRYFHHQGLLVLHIILTSSYNEVISLETEYSMDLII